MHIALQLLAFWSFALVTLCSALVLLNIFDSVIGNDLTLHSVGKEAAIAGVASFVEAACLWLVATYAPTALGRAIVVPALIVVVIYKIAHLEDWSNGDALMLLGFQVAAACVAATLLTGHFLAAVFILLVFAAILAVIASFMKGL
jgi:hypothetical protein